MSALYPNAKAFRVQVGQTVHCRYSGRAIIVAKRDLHGAVWEQMEATHPSLQRNGGCLPDDHLRYIGIQYREFEPAFIRQEPTPPVFSCGNCGACGSRWHLTSACDFKDGPLSFSPLFITKSGEALAPYPSVPPLFGEAKKSDERMTGRIGSCFATHFICHGFIDLKQVSETHNAICCRSCGLRVVIPGAIETWEDLRAYFCKIVF